MLAPPRPAVALRWRLPKGAGAVTVVAAVVAALAVPLLVGAGAAAAAEIVPLPPSGSVAVVSSGAGHGHGMSQYGARGAAAAGLTSAQIASFYYPGTALTTLASSPQIRVGLDAAVWPGGAICVRAAAGITATGEGALPTTGVTRYRLVPYGTGLTLQKGTGSSCTGGTTEGWSYYDQKVLPAQVDFSAAAGTIWTYLPDGTATVYRGTVGGVRSGASLIAVNRTSLENYTIGVVPREMPASWQAAAVGAQAIAARSYAYYEMSQAGTGAFDICDTDQCQVYGGMTHYYADGSVAWTDDPAAAQGNANQVLLYGGQPAFTQFSASNGGWTADGGQPYLPAKQDPYDNAASGDPYLDVSHSVPVGQIASYFGLRTATSVVITQRDGNGEWGGRVVSAYVTGTDGNGNSQQITTTGFGLQAALGLPTTLFNFQQVPPTVPTAVSASGSDSAVHVTWSAPASAGSSPITGYTVVAGGITRSYPASAGDAWIAGLPNGVAVTVSVSAANASGSSPAVTTSATPVAQPQGMVAVRPLRLFDTGTATVTAANPLVYGVPGHGTIPIGATAVQLALTIRASANGTLRISTDPAEAVPTRTIGYTAGRWETVTVTVPFVPSPRVIFQPTAGSVRLIADQMAYGSPSGQLVVTTVPSTIAEMPSVATGTGRVFAVRGRGAVPANATAAVLQVGGYGSAGYLRVWPDGTDVPGVSQVNVGPDGTGANVVVVPFGADGAIRLAASSTKIGAQLTVIGYLAPATGAAGKLESLPASGIADALSYGQLPAVASPTPQTLRVAPRGLLPATGMRAVVLSVVAYGRGARGSAWLYPAGTVRPRAAAVPIPAQGQLTTTVVVPVGPNGQLTLVSSGVVATLAIDAIGYVTVG